ncbi:S41 family peptidase [Massilia sp. 9I]|uniref:S41 family peptidase n=1 Tax=Massilia sp. 9I TaxID=2653152 RepID=UPI0012F054CB|nr:S41 family peptidase [Massilia sp. 9I]VXB35447.1 conserved exported hypothetical protein [Massilia sp. 9I]
MHRHLLRAAVLAASLLSSTGLSAAAPIERELVIDEALALIKAQYVFPERYEAIEQSVRKHQQAGEYAAAASEEEFVKLVTTHLRDITHDGHMGLKYQPKVRDFRPAAFTITPAQREQERRENYGLNKVEVLPGNVGYLNVIQFHDVENARDTIAAAMAFLSNTDALIIDLRDNRGGNGESMQLLASYFFKDVLTLMELRFRGQKPEQARTYAEVSGKRYLDKPVYVLTSGRTFSAGEAFVHALQSRKRVTLVGATTRGAGNPNTMLPVRTDYLLSVPIGESVNPVTGSGWEGVGVKPDVAVADKAALGIVHRRALETLRDGAKDEALRTSLVKQIEALDKS